MSITWNLSVPQGHSGLKGLKGDSGERGESGKDGVPGIPGSHGRHGEKGDKGVISRSYFVFVYTTSMRTMVTFFLHSGDTGVKGEIGPSGRSASLTDLLDPGMDSAESKFYNFYFYFHCRNEVIIKWGRTVRSIILSQCIYKPLYTSLT